MRFWTLLETESDLNFFVTQSPLFLYFFFFNDLELCTSRVWRLRTTHGVTAFMTFFPFPVLLHQIASDGYRNLDRLPFRFVVFLRFSTCSHRNPNTQTCTYCDCILIDWRICDRLMLECAFLLSTSWFWSRVLISLPWPITPSRSGLAMHININSVSFEGPYST